MSTSAFGRILSDLLHQLPHARGAVLADWEGEAVDQATRRGVTSIRLVGAHWGVIYYLTRSSFEKLALGTPCEVVFGLGKEQIFIRRITDHYYVVVSSNAHAPLTPTRRALDHAEARLLAEL